MKKNKIVSFVLVLTLLASMASLAGISAGAAATHPVDLLYATPQTVPSDEPQPSNSYVLTGYAEVENIAYAKNVTIVYTVDGTTWKETPAEYFKSTWGNREAWKFTTPVETVVGYGIACTFEFAVKYEVNGQTYWDNNNTYNYKASSGRTVGEKYPAIGIAGLTVDSYRFAQGAVTGNVYLKNIALAKDVKVRYSSDNWETFTEAKATYVKNVSPDVDFWQFSIPAEAGATIEFAVSYTAGGQTYWDNNFGENYTVVCE